MFLGKFKCPLNLGMYYTACFLKRNMSENRRDKMNSYKMLSGNLRRLKARTNKTKTTSMHSVFEECHSGCMNHPSNSRTLRACWPRERQTEREWEGGREGEFGDDTEKGVQL